ncbi:uncharacterized protein LOC111711059 isoform X3 [Eurytemora carolleeae]|uniref:uncharacterized protein LOC111711059 isoform X3 n=1 Tax=Eurytemora carolleeae TaxID=1294199 RepID=UPI000C75A728|nr:uncharacterized protein LOC111711059 isoform X3 [Eurytemora carolleeae]|eukprot:XP_023341069.1 uncharacterized protein LOC111711059 isoform X3 [Eurytemora affinis]
MKKMVVFLLVFLSLSTFSAARRSQGNRINSTCKIDTSESLFKSETVLLAKLLKVKMNNTHTLVTVRVRRVIKTYPENKKPKTEHGLIKKNDKIVISYDGRLCDKVRTRSKYIFTVNSYQMQDVKMAQGLDSPEKYSKKMRTLIHKMFCKSCSNIPRLKPVKAQNTVSIKRWRRINCKLSSGFYPRVQFSWFQRGTELNQSDSIRIKTGDKGSVINILGTPDTAGIYRCVAKNLAGSASLSSTLNVKGRGSDICNSEYCMNGAGCSIALISPGEQEAVCSCADGFSGARCQYKHATVSVIATGVGTTAVGAEGAVGIVDGATLFIVFVTFLAVAFLICFKVFLICRHNQEKSSIKISRPFNPRRGQLSPVQSSVLENLKLVGTVQDYTEGADQTIIHPLRSLSSESKSDSNIPIMTSFTSSTASVCSLKHRRHKAPNIPSLILPVQSKISTLSLDHDAQEDLLNPGIPGTLGDLPNLNLLLNPENMLFPGNSPEYAEPWDSKKCVHNKIESCHQCQKEADEIFKNCSEC